MLYTSLKTAVLPLLAAGAAARTIRVDVGRSGLTYTPDTVTASPGDVVEFHFSQNQHSVVAADFSKPCSPMGSGGFYSGIIQTTTDSPIFQVTVSSTSPMFFYCAVDEHCQNGMVGVINPSSGQTLDQFRSAASGATSGPVPNAPYGGNLVNAGQSSAASSSSRATSSAASSSAESRTSASSAPASSVSESSAPASSGMQSSAMESSAVQTTGAQTTGAQVTGGGGQGGGGGQKPTSPQSPGLQPTAAAGGLTAPLGALGGVLAGVAAFIV